MKSISTALSDHLKQDVTTLALCWKLTRRDNNVSGFSSHDSDIEFDGINYIASSGFLPSAIEDSTTLSVDNMEVEGILNADSINEEDILAGLYDFAEIDIFAINHADLTQGKLPLRHGWLGEVTIDGERFSAEMRGLTERLNTVFGELYSPSCRANFADEKCGLSSTNFETTGSVTEVTNRRVFIDNNRTEENGTFSFGKVTFTSGNNTNLSMEVKVFLDQTIELSLPMPYNIQVSDTYTIQEGCDKIFSTCRDRFNNSINFRGEPHIPGTDRLLQTSSTRNN